MKRYGLCCISLELHDQGYKFQTITATRYFKLDKVVRKAKVLDILHNNLQVTLKTMQLCSSKGWVYRMSSSLFPLLNHPNAELSWDEAIEDERIDDALFKMKQYLIRSKLRVSLHPDQFVVPASANPSVVEKSIIELDNHAEFMDSLGLAKSYDYPINIHMNSYKGHTLSDITARFTNAYKRLSQSARSRLVLENEDKPNSWNTNQLYDNVYSSLNIPITFDCLHYRCNPGGAEMAEAINLAKSTWGTYRPLFHFSDSDPDKTNPREHRDYPVGIPVDYFRLDDVDFDMEFKMKDRAIQRLVDNYPISLNTENV